jgi:hypothetical protein
MALFTKLPENIELSIIKNATLSDLSDHLHLRKQKQKLLVSILYNTHCTGCGHYNLVSLRGYVGQYCDKRCWRYFDDTEDSGYDTERAHNLDYIFEKYDYILDGNDKFDKFDTISLAISKRHRPYYNQLSPSGKVWPMLNKPCYNEVILNNNI